MRISYNKFGYRKNRIATGNTRSRRMGCANGCIQQRQSLVAWRLAAHANDQSSIMQMLCMQRDKHSTEKHITIDAYVVWFASFRHGYIASTSSDSVRSTCRKSRTGESAA